MPDLSVWTWAHNCCLAPAGTPEYVAPEILLNERYRGITAGQHRILQDISYLPGRGSFCG